MNKDIVEDILEKIAEWESITNIKAQHIYLGQREIWLLKIWISEHIVNLKDCSKTQSNVFGDRKLHEVKTEGHLGIS